MMEPPEPTERTSPGREKRRRLFEQEVIRLMDRLYGTALRLTRNPDDAEDVVAEAVERAWTRLDDLRDWEHFEGWLFRVLNNTFISMWRRRRSRQDRETEFDDPDSAASPDERDFSLYRKLHQPFLLWWGTPQDQFLDRLVLDDLQRALDSLPDPFRVVVVLVEVQGYTYDEVAGLLEVPVGTVRSRLSRARALLQKRLWEYSNRPAAARGPHSGESSTDGERP